MKKRVLAFVLAIIMILTAVPLNVFATDSSETTAAGPVDPGTVNGDQDETTAPDANVQDLGDQVNDGISQLDLDGETEEAGEPGDEEETPEAPNPDGEQPAEDPEEDPEEEPVQIPTIPVTAQIEWVDRDNNEELRPVLTVNSEGEPDDAAALAAYLGTFYVEKYSMDGELLETTTALPEGATYTRTGPNSGRITCDMPEEVDEEGEPTCVYVIRQSSAALIGMEGYNYNTDRPSENEDIFDPDPIVDFMSVDNVFYVKGLDGAHIVDGEHPEIISGVLGEAGPFVVYCDGVEMGPFASTEAPFYTVVHDPATGISTVTLKGLPAFDPTTQNDIQYSFAISTDEETPDKTTDGTDNYLIEYDNAAVPNHGTEVTRVYNGGTIKLTLDDILVYRATKYWLDEDPSQRPNASFSLWRYTDMRDGSTSYRTASPVRDANNNQYNFSIVGSQQGTVTELVVLGADGFPVELPQYDANGYEYIYFLRETMSGGSASYEQVFAENIGLDDDGEPVSIVEQVRLDSADRSIYHEGIIANRITATTTASTVKSWEAAAYIDNIRDIEVKMQLFSSPEPENGEDPVWTACTNENGQPIIESESGFSSVMTSKTFSKGMPAYDELGNRLIYQWREVGVFENGENVLNDNGTFVLGVNEQNSVGNGSQRDIHGFTYNRQNEEFFTSEEDEYGNVVNRLQGLLDYIVVKNWLDADGNLIEAPEGASVTFGIFNNQGIEPIFITLNGEQDDENDLEINPWIAQINNLPKYTEEGVLIEYYVREADPFAGYQTITYDISEDRVATVYNGPGRILEIPVFKEWIDDDDAACRYPSNVELVYNPTGEVVARTQLVESESWFDLINVPGSFLGEYSENNPRWDKDNYSIREVSLGANGEYPVVANNSTTYHDENTVSNETVTTDRHMYVTRYYTNADGILTVSNRRVGTVDVNVTKQWTDLGARTSLRPGAVLRLTSDNPEVIIDYNNNTVTVPGVKTVSLPTSITVDSTRVSGPDGQVSYSFNGLPKYDSEGKVIHYSVYESWSDDEAAATAANGYYHSRATSSYQDMFKNTVPARSEEEHDLLVVNVENYRADNQDVIFYKEWHDAYSYQHGKRPDIYVMLYSTTDVDEYDINASTDIETINYLGFKNNVWDIDQREGRADASELHWQVVFHNQPRFDSRGAYITYYASESANGNVAEFDYHDTRFKNDALQEELLENNNAWVETATNGQVVLREDGTFVNGIENQVRLIGRKIWTGLPEGFIGELPYIDVEVVRTDANGANPTDPIQDNEGNTVGLYGMQIGRNATNVLFTFYAGDKTMGGIERYHYDFSPEKYDADGNLYYYSFREFIRNTAETPEEMFSRAPLNEDGEPEIDLDDLFEYSTDGNLILTNRYLPTEYVGTVAIHKEWQNRPANVPYPAITFRLHRVYQSVEGQSTDIVVSNRTVQASEWVSGENVSFNGTFPVYAPDGFKFIYYVEEVAVNGYTGTFNEMTGDITLVSAEDENLDATLAASLVEKGAFTFNRPEGEGTANASGATAAYTNKYIPPVTKVTGTKTWNDRNNLFQTRPDINDANDILRLTLYRSADAQVVNGVNQNNGIAQQVVTGIEPDWITNSDGNWVYTYNSLDIYAPNGMPWKYKVVENLAPGYASNYSNQTWGNKTANTSLNNQGTSTTNMGSKQNALHVTLKITKKWDAKDNLYIRPDVVFELQVNIGGTGWQHASQAPVFGSVTSPVFSTTDAGAWTFRLSDKGTSGGVTYNASTSTYTAQWSNFPASVYVDGEWKSVQYRFVEIMIADDDGNLQPVFDGHTAATGTTDCLSDPIGYPERTNGEYEPSTTTASTTSNGVTTTNSTTQNPVEGGTVSLDATKVWEGDNDNFYSTRPASITFNVERSIDGVNFSNLIDNNNHAVTMTVNAANGWHTSIRGLPKYDQQGRQITYRAVENTVDPRYELVGQTNVLNDAGTIYVSTITNRLRVVPLNGTKTWVTPFTISDVEQGKVNLTLMRRISTQSTGEVVTYKDGQPAWTISNDANVFNYSYVNLPAYDANGNTYVYYVVESAVPGYASAHDDARMNITNTITAVTLQKLRAVDGQALSPVFDDALELTVLDASGRTVAVWTRGENANVGTFAIASGLASIADYANVYTANGILYGLPYGTYTVRETGTPDDLVTAADQTFTISSSTLVTAPYEVEVIDVQKISVTLDGFKFFTGFPVDSEIDSVFTFTISERGANGGPTLIDTQSVHMRAESGEQLNQVAYQFDPIWYTQAGRHNYVVTETFGNQDGVTYDTRQYTVTVVVAADPSNGGALRAYISGANEDGSGLNFNNEYEAAPVTVHLSGVKNFTGMPSDSLVDSVFTFTLNRVNADGTRTQIDTKDVHMLGANGQQTSVSYDFSNITYDEVGTYTYEVVETVGNQSGVTYATNTHSIVVTVTDTGSGFLTASIAVDGGTPTTNTVVRNEDGTVTNSAEVPGMDFNNTYLANPVSVTLQGSKNYTGIPADSTVQSAFTFTLSEGGTVIDSKTVNMYANGTQLEDVSYAFNTITYTQAGVHTYTVTETAGNQRGVTYATTSYTVVVTVTDSGDGQLDAVVTIDGVQVADSDGDEAISVPGLNFVNTYTALPVDVTLKGTKNYSGFPTDSTINSAFTFTLSDEDGEVIDTKTVNMLNDDGQQNSVAYAFDALHYTEVGTYTYTVNETVGSQHGVTYSEKSYTVVVTVTDNGDGQLDASVAVTDNDTETTVTTTSNDAAAVEVPGIDFENSYLADPVGVTLKGIKYYEDFPEDSIIDSEFTFELYQVTEAEPEPLPAALDGEDEDPAGPTLTLLESATVHMMDEDGNQLDQIGYTFSEMTYTEVGVYTYKVVETAGTQHGVTYSTEYYDVVVTVTDSGNGYLNASVAVTDAAGNTSTYTSNDAPVLEIEGFNFTNSYLADPTYVQLSGVKNYEGMPEDSIVNSVFEFSLYEMADPEPEIDYLALEEDPEEPAPVVPGEPEPVWNLIDTQTVEMFNEEDGQQQTIGFTFNIMEYTEIGVHTYKVVETVGSQDGVIYDENTYTLVVIVSDEGDGYLKAEIYVDGDENAVITEPVFDEDGNMVYVAEVGGIDFYNSYVPAPVDVNLDGTKIFTDFPEDSETTIEFTFALSEITEEDGETVKTLVDTQTIEMMDEEGNQISELGYIFETLTFDKVGVYTYEVSEVAGTQDGVIYDENVYTVVITVTDDGAGFLYAAVDACDSEGNVIAAAEDNIDTLEVNVGGFDFSNSYLAAPVDVVFHGIKLLENFPNGITQHLQFVFDLIAVDEEGNETVVDVQTVTESGEFVFGPQSFSEVGVHTYKIVEERGRLSFVTYDDTEYTITVTVTDDGNGFLIATVDGVDDEGNMIADAVAGTELVNVYDFNFTNRFLPPDVPPSGDEDPYGSLTVQKTVAGNLGDRNQLFTFTITFDAEDPYYYEGGEYYGLISSGDSIQLRHGESITIYRLPAGTEYTVEESDNEGYTVTSEGTVGTILENVECIAHFTNTKESPKTGDTTNPILWTGAMLGSAAVAVGTLAVRRRKEENED